MAQSSTDLNLGSLAKKLLSLMMMEINLRRPMGRIGSIETSSTSENAVAILFLVLAFAIDQSGSLLWPTLYLAC